MCLVVVKFADNNNNRSNCGSNCYGKIGASNLIFASNVRKRFKIGTYKKQTPFIKTIKVVIPVADVELLRCSCIGCNAVVVLL